MNRVRGILFALLVFMGWGMLWGTPCVVNAGALQWPLRSSPPVVETSSLQKEQDALKAYAEGVRLFQAAQATETQSPASVIQLKKQAQKAFEQAVLLNPNLVEAHANWGYLCLSQNHPKQALLHFQQALTLRPQDETAMSGLAVALHESGQSDQAIETFLKLTQYYPQVERHWFNLGTIYQALHANEKAIAAYQEALLRNPKHPPSFFNLATVYHEQDQRAQAWRYYERCIQMNPGSALALQAQYRLKMLEALPVSSSTVPITKK